MLCDKCLTKVIIPKLREVDIAVLQYLYNEKINIAQVAQHQNYIAKQINISPFRTVMALFRLECYDMVEQQQWSKANNFYLTDNGVKALNYLIERMEE